jgi:hypothetical protein
MAACNKATFGCTGQLDPPSTLYNLRRLPFKVTCTHSFLARTPFLRRLAQKRALEETAKKARETGKGADAFATPDYSLPVSVAGHKGARGMLHLKLGLCLWMFCGLGLASDSLYSRKRAQVSTGPDTTADQVRVERARGMEQLKLGPFFVDSLLL